MANSQPHSPLAAQMRAFSLIELLAVLALVAILSATVVVRLSGPIQHAKFGHALEELAHADRTIRQHCRRFNHTADLYVEGDKGLLKCGLSDRSKAGQESRWLLGSAVRVDRVVTVASKNNSASVPIHFAVDGTSETYAVHLTTSNGLQEWIIFAGVTGQWTRINEERQIDELFQAVSSPGSDPH